MSSGIEETFALDTMRRRTLQVSPSSDSATQVTPESQNPIAQAKEEWFKIQKELPPQITRRNIQMISVGGVIGTGLFLGISQSLRDGGPIGMLIGYAATGSIVYAVVVSLAEMVAFLPNVGGPVGLADLYVDRALGFAMGWNAWYNWTIVLPAELSAAAVIASVYVSKGVANYSGIVQKLNLGVTSVLLVAAVTINFLGRYGEYEFWFATIKICTIVILIIIGIVLDTIKLPTADIIPAFNSSISGVPSIPSTPDCIPHVFNQTIVKMSIGFKYLSCPGSFVQYKGIPGATGKVLGVWSVLMQAIFSYCGSEIPGIAGAEVENPHKNIPRAVKKLWIRIFLFYVFGVFVAGLIVPFNHPKLWPHDSNNGQDYVQSSPFIIAMQTAGTGIFPKIVSAFFMLSAWSAATSDVYISSRFMFFLARRGHAPRFLGTLISRQKTKAALDSIRGVTSESTLNSKRLVIPIYAVLVATLFAFLAFLPARGANAEQAFYWLSSMTAAAAMLSWVSMMITYLRWHAGIKHAENSDPKFKADHPELYPRPILQPFLAWYAIVTCTAILLLHGWAVFTINEVRRIAAEPGDIAPVADPVLGGPFVLVFVTSYLPIPLFLLCIFGYKLIKQTSFVQLHEMDFDQGDISATEERSPKTVIRRLTNILF